MKPILKKVFAAVGSPAELARRLKITRSAVHQWKEIPTKKVIAVEEITGIHRSKLRPDIYPPEKSCK